MTNRPFLRLSIARMGAVVNTFPVQSVKVMGFCHVVEFRRISCPLSGGSAKRWGFAQVSALSRHNPPTCFTGHPPKRGDKNPVPPIRGLAAKLTGGLRRFLLCFVTTPRPVSQVTPLRGGTRTTIIHHSIFIIHSAGDHRSPLRPLSKLHRTPKKSSGGLWYAALFQPHFIEIRLYV